MSGWIKLHRKLKHHWLYPKTRPFTKYEAWIDLLLNVNHETAKVNIGNEIFICNPGESLKSVNTWAKRWNWSQSRVRRFFKLLIKDRMVTVNNMNQKSTKITICNWETYQIDRRTDGEQMANRWRTSGDKQEEERMIKNEKNGYIEPPDFPQNGALIEKTWQMFRDKAYHHRDISGLAVTVFGPEKEQVKEVLRMADNDLGLIAQKLDWHFSRDDDYARDKRWAFWLFRHRYNELTEEEKDDFWDD